MSIFYVLRGPHFFRIGATAIYWRGLALALLVVFGLALAVEPMKQMLGTGVTFVLGVASLFIASVAAATFDRDHQPM